MHWTKPGLLLLILAAGCPPSATPAHDGGTDAGCPPPCTPPPLEPLCPDLDGGACTDDAPCCPGLLCSDAGRCVLPANPCLGLHGERPRASGCACDPMSGGAGGCSPGYSCLPDLHCHPLPPDAGVPVPCPLTPCDPNGARPLCFPAGKCGCVTTSESNGDSCFRAGQICDQSSFTPACRLPLLGEPCNPSPGCQPPLPPSSPGLECDADPSGAYLYVCRAICTSNADCPNGWQFCSRPDGGANGRCADNPCDHPYAPCSLHLPGGTVGGAQGVCLPFGVLQANPDGTKQAVSVGLCLEASSQSGASGVVCDRLFRRAEDGGAPGGPGSFCNLVNVCAPSGTCAPACYLTDGGPPCPSGGLHCKKIDPRPFSTARDPDSGVLVGSGACQ